MASKSKSKSKSKSVIMKHENHQMQQNSFSETLTTPSLPQKNSISSVQNNTRPSSSSSSSSRKRIRPLDQALTVAAERPIIRPHSLLFQAYRTIGVVCGNGKSRLHVMGGQRFLTVSAGKSWTTYNLESIRMVMRAYDASDGDGDGDNDGAADQNQLTIDAVESVKDYTFAAIGRKIKIYKRQKEITAVKTEQKTIELVSIGTVLLAVGSTTITVMDVTELIKPSEKRVNTTHDKNMINGWDANDQMDEVAGKTEEAAEKHEVYSINIPSEIIDRALPGVNRTITTVIHPATYLNKILIAYTDCVELFNIHTRKVIFTFQEADVVCMEQSPALDVIALGFRSGRIRLINIKTNKSIMSFVSPSTVTALAFRTDLHPLLASAAGDNIYVWDLEKKQFHSSLQAHEALITSLHFLPNEPILVSNGCDNSIKEWIFESDGSVRLLKSRAGHYEPPTRVQFFNDESDPRLLTLLTAGEDCTLRSFCIEREEQSWEYSQGSIERQSRALKVPLKQLKASRIIDFKAIALTQRQGGSDYANIVSAHENQAAARIWRSANKALDVKGLAKKGTTSPTPVTAVCLSACGNFAFIGHADGSLEKFNMQSSILRGFAKKITHSISGLAVSALNKHVIASSSDGMVTFWDFKLSNIVKQVRLDSECTLISFNRDNGLLAVSTADLLVHVIDTATYAVVRRFKGHTHHINAIVLSPDGRLLLTASADSTIRVFDLPAGRLVDWMAFNRPATSIAFAPGMDYIATTHVDHLGVSLWVNRSFFSNIYYQSNLEKPFNMEAINSSNESHHTSIGSIEADDLNQLSWEERAEANGDIDRFSLITYSAVPRAKWHTLAYLDIIQERNKPKEAPKTPAAVPFFLSSLAAVGDAEPARTDTKDQDTSGDTNNNTTASHFLHSAGSTDRPTIISRLSNAVSTSSLEDAMDWLKSLSVSHLDAEFRLIGVDFDEKQDESELLTIVKFLTMALESRRDFEFVQSLISLFIRIHGTSLLKYRSVAAAVQLLKQVQSELWDQLQSMFHANMAIVAQLQGTLLAQ